MLLICLLLLCLFIALTFFRRKKAADATAKSPATTASDRPADCCGQHEVCERDSLLLSPSSAADYYDDEELDAYMGIEADAYSDEQLTAFRDVLYTLPDDEVRPWLHSLRQRNILLPAALRDEAVLLSNY